MIITQVESLDQVTNAVFYTRFPQWNWDGKTLRPLNDAAKAVPQTGTT